MILKLLVLWLSCMQFARSASIFTLFKTYHALYGYQCIGTGLLRRRHFVTRSAQVAVTRNDDTNGGKAGDDASVVHRSNHVYVGNLAWDVTWQDLKDHMKRAGGTVLHADVLLEASGRSKGYGLVEFAFVKDATDAILKLNDTKLKGRPIFIREDRKVNSRNSRNVLLYVGNLDDKTNWKDLKDHFWTVGGVLRADIIRESEDAYEIVEFATAEDAMYAMAQLHESNLNGRQIIVREDRER